MCVVFLDTNVGQVCIVKFRLAKVCALILGLIVCFNASSVVLADEYAGYVVESYEKYNIDFYDFERVLLDYATNYEGKTHEKIFGKGYSIQWCAEYVNKMLTDAYTECGWDIEGAWGADSNNFGLAPCWAKSFVENTYGGYYCWKSWESNHIGYYGYATDNYMNYIPRVGDIVCVNWNKKADADPNEPNPNGKDINHVGIVVRVDSLYSIYVSEGNIGSNDDPRYNKVINRSWTRTSLTEKFANPTGKIIAVCRPLLPDYLENMDPYEVDLSSLTCADEVYSIFYKKNNNEVEARKTEN